MFEELDIKFPLVEFFLNRGNGEERGFAIRRVSMMRSELEWCLRQRHGEDRVSDEIFGSVRTEIHKFKASMMEMMVHTAKGGFIL